MESSTGGAMSRVSPWYVDSRPLSFPGEVLSQGQPSPPQLLPRDPEPPGRTNSSMFGRLAPHPGQLSEYERECESRRPRPWWVGLNGETGSPPQEFSQKESWEGVGAPSRGNSLIKASGVYTAQGAESLQVGTPLGCPHPRDHG